VTSLLLVEVSCMLEYYKKSHEFLDQFLCSNTSDSLLVSCLYRDRSLFISSSIRIIEDKCFRRRIQLTISILEGAIITPSNFGNSSFKSLHLRICFCYYKYVFVPKKIETFLFLKALSYFIIFTRILLFLFLFSRILLFLVWPAGYNLLVLRCPLRWPAFLE
jgi:hypothetical protein